MFSPENLSKILRLDWETDRIVKFNIHHLDICDLNEFDKKILTTFPDYKKHLENLTNNSLAFTAMSEGEIYGLGSVRAGLFLAHMWDVEPSHFIAVHCNFLNTLHSKQEQSGYSSRSVHQMS